MSPIKAKEEENKPDNVDKVQFLKGSEIDNIKCLRPGLLKALSTQLSTLRNRKN